VLGLYHDAEHRYFCEAVLGGEYAIEVGPLTSVTTALRALDKSGPLVGWAKRETAACAVRNLDALQAMVKESGVENAQKWLSSIPDYQRDTAADSGSNIHMLCEALANGEPITDEQLALPRVQQYQRFRAEFAPEYVGIEQQVVNFTHAYAGTGDFWARMLVPYPDGPKVRTPYEGGTMPDHPQLWLVDIKNSNLDKNGPYDDHWLQLAGLNGAEFWGWPGRDDLVEAPKAERFGILQLADDHYNLWEGKITDREFAIFVALKQAHEWLKTDLRGIKAGKARP
jgi:hypothetical protein